MPSDAKKFYITTPIAYVNAPPHLGHVLEFTQADVLARYYRQKGRDVFFLTGTDEHGAKVVQSAEAAGEEVKKFVDDNAQKFKGLKELLNLSWDDFIRTSDKERHWPNVVNLWQALANKGDIYKKNYRGLYCVGHEAFVTEKDLADGICKDHGKAPEVVEEENYFFRLSKYDSRVREAIKLKEIKIIPESRENEIMNFIDQGLEDISFSRPRKDLSWGIPVPGDDTQTIYVWADALANYLSPQGWWPADVQMIGKDILRFHALFWPAMLLSAGLPLPKNIFVHGHITVEGQKMSKTLGNVVDPVELVNKYGTDAVRYYLLREIPPTDDGDFSYKKFEERYNGDLANGLGNFAARVLTLGEKIGEVKFSEADAEKNVLDKVELTKTLVDQKMEEYKFHEALAAIWDLISFGDGYLNENKPWADRSENRVRSILNLVFILQNAAGLLEPFLPQTTHKIYNNIILTDGSLKMKKGEVLFPRVS